MMLSLCAIDIFHFPSVQKEYDQTKKKIRGKEVFLAPLVLRLIPAN
jgi:hypothetical protein